MEHEISPSGNSASTPDEDEEYEADVAWAAVVDAAVVVVADEDEGGELAATEDVAFAEEVET